MIVNREKSGVIEGVGQNKLRVVIDCSDREEAEAATTRDEAMRVAAENGFGNGGLCDNPVISPIGSDGEPLEGLEATSPGATVLGFRSEYTFANRV